MKSILIILLAAGCLGSCGKNFSTGLSIGKRATSMLAPEKKCAMPVQEANDAKKEKDYTQMGFSAMSLPGRF